MFVKYVKKNFPNIYQILVALGIALWFDGINMITHSIFPNTRATGIIFIFIALIIFFSDDGSLHELHAMNNESNNNQTRNQAAAISAYNY